MGKSEAVGLNPGEPLDPFILTWEVLQFEPHKEVGKQFGVLLAS